MKAAMFTNVPCGFIFFPLAEGGDYGGMKGAEWGTFEGILDGAETALAETVPKAGMGAEGIIYP